MAAGSIPFVELLLFLSITSLSLAAVSISIQPQEISLEEGDTAEFICKLRVSSKYDCEDQGFLYWSKEGGILISNSTDVMPNFYNKFSVSLDYTRTSRQTKCEYSLQLHNITKSMGGLYGCVYYPREEYTEDFPYEIVGTANLLIKSQPAPQYPLCSATILPNGDYGDHMRFRCESEEGHPSVALYWWFNGAMLDGILTRPRRNYIRLDYVISKNMFAKFADKRIKCTMAGESEGANIFNECSLDTGITVSLESTHINVTPVRETVTTLICQVNASIPYDLIWYYKDTQIDATKAGDRFLVETSARALHIRNMTISDNGSEIACEARSVFGAVKATTVLDVGAISSPTGLGKRKSVNTGAIVGLITCGFIIILCVNVALCMSTKKKQANSSKPKSYTATNNNTAIRPMDTDEESEDEQEDTHRPDSAVLMMPADLSEGIRYANVSRTVSADSTEMRQSRLLSSVPSSVHYQSPSSLNESQDTTQPLALEMSSSGSETSGSQEYLKSGSYTARENSYADLHSLRNYECPRPRAEREDSGVDVRQSYVSMNGHEDGVMEDTYEPIDMNNEDHDPEDPRPEPPSAPVPHKSRTRRGLRSSPLHPLPITPNQDEYMDMKHGNNKRKDKTARQSLPEKLPDETPVQNSTQTHHRSATIASPRSTHKALIQKFENGPSKNCNNKKLPERKENHNLNKDNFKGIKEKFKGSKENLKNGTENLKHAMFKKRVPSNPSSAESPKMKRKLKRQARQNEMDYQDLDRSSMSSSEGSSAYQQICLARTGGQIEDSGVYENIDS